MTLQEIKDTMHIVRTETFNFCGDMNILPSLDETASFSVMVSILTFSLLPYSTKCHINHFQWDRLIDNTVKKIILDNL